VSEFAATRFTKRMILAMTASLTFRAILPKATANAAELQDNSRTHAIASAAAAFLAMLDEDQRTHLCFPFPSEQRATAAYFKGGMNGNITFVGEQLGRSMWTNFPVSDVPRAGLRLGALDQRQLDAAMKLLKVLLSDRGYRKTQEIMDSDQALSDQGTDFASGRAFYAIGIFGEPNTQTPWMIQFGGHHLGLNVTMVGPHGVLAPMLTGAQPAVYQTGGRTVRALAAENDKAFALLQSLNEEQRTRAIWSGY
jgi:hypothetical protein